MCNGWLLCTWTHMVTGTQSTYGLIKIVNFNPQRITSLYGVLKLCECLDTAFSLNSLHPQRAAICRLSVIGFEQPGQQPGSYDLYRGSCRARLDNPQRGHFPHKGVSVLSYCSSSSSIQLFGTLSLIVNTCDLSVELRPTSSF